jgi:hypothetical protein
MRTAAGSRAAELGTGSDLGVPAIARLGGFPAIIFPIRKTRPARRNQQHHKATFSILIIISKTIL